MNREGRGKREEGEGRGRGGRTSSITLSYICLIQPELILCHFGKVSAILPEQVSDLNEYQIPIGGREIGKGREGKKRKKRKEKKG